MPKKKTVKKPAPKKAIKKLAKLVDDAKIEHIGKKLNEIMAPHPDLSEEYTQQAILNGAEEEKRRRMEGRFVVDEPAEKEHLFKDSGMVAGLREWDRNPRKISPSEQRILSKGMDEYGDLSGVVLNVRNGMLVGGNQRSRIFAPSDEITIVHRFETPTPKGTVAIGYVTHAGERFAYREVDWTEAKHAAAGLMANKAGGDWDWSKLTPMMSELDASGGLTDLELTGFNNVEWEDMMAANFHTGSEKAVEGEADRGQSTRDSLENYENQALRKIELWVPREEYDALVKRLDVAAKTFGFTSYTDVFLAAFNGMEVSVPEEASNE